MSELVRYDAMCRAIDVAHDFDEIKDIRDKAAMLEAAMRIAGNQTAELRCWEIRQRAQRKANQLYDAQPKAPAGRPSKEKKNRSDKPTNLEEPKTLAEHGVTKQEMSEWRELAKVPQDEFDATLAQAVAEGKKLSVDEITKKKPAERSLNSTIALWLWGRVLDFERNGTLRLNAADCIKELEGHQVDDIVRLGPQIVEWLSGIVKRAKGQNNG